MVSPRPDLAGLTDKEGKAPANLIGVYETLEYIDTSVALIKTIMPAIRKIGAIYNQAEPQSTDAFERIRAQCAKSGIILIALPVNNSSETQLAVQSLISKGIDGFFALPDNSVFASFETIAKSCNDAKIPVFTSEAGLVARGALVSFGADFHEWGYQAGEQVAMFLKNKSLEGLKPEIVKVRKKVFNPETAARFNINFDSSFVAFK